ncbi:hypothetical protein BDK89_1201 [Ilumatobacter fluminis]|uniref:Coenzyme PQQ synthesis protein D (PqqD) n=1 Tax=Ilumatobacter fluminis TaxID=467091 RepID=A0A4R7HZE0_9ACTN|nr:hypothetical protein [Ilumatobacter fluminis]TDT15626.1 hypothetical protein BDK89_1201 [Ilumatobacter fluminis]
MPRYRASASTAAEILDGEAIVIDLASGAYFSFTGWTTWAWESLTAGADSDEIAAVFADHGGIDEFVEQLTSAGLLVARDGGDPEPMPQRPDGDVEPLQFDRFDDMADMIKIDPVHDVSQEAGWPQPADG